jgi:hypothetical protein
MILPLMRIASCRPRHGVDFLLTRRSTPTTSRCWIMTRRSGERASDSSADRWKYRRRRASSNRRPMGTRSGLGHPYHRGTAGTAPKDSRASGCQVSFHLIAACGLTAPFFRLGGRRSSPNHEIIFLTPIPAPRVLHRYICNSTSPVSQGTGGAALLRRSDLVTNRVPTTNDRRGCGPTCAPSRPGKSGIMWQTH